MTEQRSATTVSRPHQVAPDTPDEHPELIRASAARSPGRWLASVLLLVFSAWIVYALVTNPGFQWPVVGRYLFARQILAGAGVTLYIVALSMTIAIVLGVALGVMRLSRNRTSYLFASGYVWFFRGTPVLVQLIFWFNLASLYPQVKLGIPFGGPKIMSVSSNSLMTPVVAAVLGLSLNEAAYYAEIVRAGIISVDPGQTIAARALGMRPTQLTWHIVLPQAMRAIVPPTGNEIISMLKYSALASVIAVPELLHSAQDIYNANYEIIPLLIVASLWYLVMVTVLSLGQRYVERYFARGAVDHADRTVSFAARYLSLRRG